MKRFVRLLTAGLAAAASPFSVAMSQIPPERAGHLFLLRIHGGSNDDTNYLAYHAVPGDRDSLIVQRNLGVLFQDGRVEISAEKCPGLRPAVEALERVPWPAVHLGPAPNLPYVEPEQLVSYAFYGTIGFTNAMSWESTIRILDVRGQPREPFAEWAHRLVRTVDACVARGPG